MLFKLLKLFGLDVPAKVVAAKLVIEQRAEEVANTSGRRCRLPRYSRPCLHSLGF